MSSNNDEFGLLGWPSMSSLFGETNSNQHIAKTYRTTEVLNKIKQMGASPLDVLLVGATGVREIFYHQCLIW